MSAHQYELTNTLRKYYKAKILSKDECKQYIRDGIALIDRFIDARTLWEKAFEQGIKHDHSIYDLYYVTIAQENNGILITNDSTLAQICDKESISYII
jgi:predicted nucleic acid-binding protein